MSVVLTTKRLNSLLGHLKIEPVKLASASVEELDIILEPLPKEDRKFLFITNSNINKNISGSMLKVSRRDYGRYLNNDVITNYTGAFIKNNFTSVDYKDIINEVLEKEYIVIHRDNISGNSVVIIDDALLEHTVNGNSRYFIVALSAMLVYNEVVSNRCTPLGTIQQLLKYI